jgi:hypothetical protein
MPRDSRAEEFTANWKSAVRQPGYFYFVRAQGPTLIFGSHPRFSMQNQNRRPFSGGDFDLSTTVKRANQRE